MKFKEKINEICFCYLSELKNKQTRELKLRSNRSNFGQIPQSRKKLETNFNLKKSVTVIKSITEIMYYRSPLQKKVFLEGVYFTFIEDFL